MPPQPHLVAGITHSIFTGMQATGIPAHLAMANELTTVVSHTQRLKEAVLARCDELPAALTNVMLSKFTINGALPITVDSMKEMLSAAITATLDISNSIAWSVFVAYIDSRLYTPTTPPTPLRLRERERERQESIQTRTKTQNEPY